MKKHGNLLKFILAITSALVCIPISAQFDGGVISPVEYPVSQTEAFTVLKTHFLDREVDYYLMDGYSANEWTFFVDAKPNSPWSHTCYVATVLKNKSSITMTPTVHLSEMITPPDANFVALEVTGLPIKWNDSDLTLSELNSGLFNNQYKNNVYAVILFTDRQFTKQTYYFRNDCCFIYKTLTSKYQIPKDHIFPLLYDKLVGDGTRSHEYTNWYDLDGDDIEEPNADVSHSGNLENAINQIHSNIQKGDIFFLFVTGAGDLNEDGTSSITLCPNEVFSQSDLFNLIEPIREKGAIMNLVFGQNRSQGFVEQFSRNGYVVANACSENEDINLCNGPSYSEFLYRWTSAIAGKRPVGSSSNSVNYETVNADSNHDGYVSMEEAFKYAKSHDEFLNDTVKKETPQYYSGPADLGKMLSFNRIPSISDLCIRDNITDCGTEPNTSSTIYWDSPDIWVRNANDDVIAHENPEYSLDHTKAYIKVKVHNNGLNDYSFGKWLHISWAQAATTYNESVWNDQTSSSMPTSGKLAAIPIGAIPANSERIVTGEWSLPAYFLDNDSLSNKNSFSIFAEITDSPDSSSATKRNRLKILASNDAAQKNTAVIKQNEVLDYIKVVLRNNTYTPQYYSMEIAPRDDSDAEFYTKGFIEVSIPQDTYTLLNSNGLQIYGANTYLSGNATICQFNSTENSLSHLLLSPGDAKEIEIRFNFIVTSNESKSYVFDLIQRDSSSQIVGGLTFEVESPGEFVVIPLSISSEPGENGGVNLSVDNESFRHIEWRNVNNETIGTQENINVLPGTNNDRFSVAGVTEQGEIGMTSISLEGSYGIKSLSNDNAGKLKVTFCDAVENGSQLIISSVTNGQNMFTVFVEEGAEEATLDISDLASGIYSVSLVKGGKVVDTKCFSNK